LNNLCSRIFHAQTSNPRLKNKGVNEASTILEGCNYFGFDDNDMIVKITGKYPLNSDFLIQMIQKNPEYDAFVKLDPHGQVFTGCFAMRYKYFKQMLEQLDLTYMERYMISIEREVANYLRYHNIKTLKLHKVGVIPELVFHQTKETFAKIVSTISQQKKGAYLRFGDGEINQAIGKPNSTQKPCHGLMIEMREALTLNGPTIFKTLPLYCTEFDGYEEGMFPGNHEVSFSWAMHILQVAKKLWGAPIKNVYSHAALHFSATQDPGACIKFLHFLKNSNCCLFIGNENIPAHMRELLFGPDCAFVPTPARQSYEEIDRIEQECLDKIPKDHRYKIIITAMGSAGKALQKRLWHKLDNVFLFDFGSLMDALCGWNTRAWITLTGFDHHVFIKLLKEYYETHN